MPSDYIKIEARKELARRKFWDYCRLMAKDFYRDDRKYLKHLCDELEEFSRSDERILVINMPPRHGKTRTAIMFAQWILGLNPQEMIMTGSYNEILSKQFSKGVRNAIMEQKASDDYLVYNDIFPNTIIKEGEAGANLWAVDGQHFSFLATSPQATATGFGATYLIVDDLIKSADEAYNDNNLDKLWSWLTNTMLTRLEEGAKLIIVMTRWSTKDVAGRAMKFFDESNLTYRLVSYKALQDDDTMLCEDILSRESYDFRIKLIGAHVASANYQQIPIDVKGVLYRNLKKWQELPPFEVVYNYTDVADQGKDWTCSICYGVYRGEAYILDIIYTADGMEITEPQTAEMLMKNKVRVAYLESNGGGMGFKRSVERILWENYNSRYTKIKAFHQRKNKMARIITNSTFVMDNVYFPHNWEIKYPEFYNDIMTFQRIGTNARDDAADALTGVAESIMGSNDMGSDVSDQIKALKELRL